MSGWKKTKIVSFFAKGKQKPKKKAGGTDRRNTLNSIDVTKSFKACAWIDGVKSVFLLYNIANKSSNRSPRHIFMPSL